MTKEDVNIFAKRLQSRLSKKGVKLSLSECRETIQSTFTEAPTGDELTCLVNTLTGSVEQEVVTELTTIPTELTVESSSCEKVISTGPVTTEESEGSELVVNGSVALGSTPQQATIKQKIEENFLGEPSPIKEKILTYATEQTFRDTEELNSFLTELRGMELNVLCQVVDNHHRRRTEAFDSVTEIIDKQVEAGLERQKKFQRDYRQQLNQFSSQMQERFRQGGLAQNVV
ncbi:MAG: hypothetical protein F6K21_05650 [Symploca sp. SIO2D2]|nr:hypothetical protein [Symploca sp. SIO2D2]